AAELLHPEGQVDAEHDDDAEQDQREVIDHAGGGPDPGYRYPAEDQDPRADEHAEGGDRAGDPGEAGVDAFRDAQGLGDRFRDEDAEHVPADGGEGGVVKQRGAPFEQPAFLELGGAAGPAELVVAPPPDVPDDEGDHRGVGQDDPPPEVPAAHRGSPRLPLRNSGGAKGATPTGSSPTSSVGGPSVISRRTSAAWRAVSGGRPAQTASSTPAYGLAAKPWSPATPGPGSRAPHGAAPTRPRWCRHQSAASRPLPAGCRAAQPATAPGPDRPAPGSTGPHPRRSSETPTTRWAPPPHPWRRPTRRFGTPHAARLPGGLRARATSPAAAHPPPPGAASPKREGRCRPSRSRGNTAPAG